MTQEYEMGLRDIRPLPASMILHLNDSLKDTEISILREHLNESQKEVQRLNCFIQSLMALLNV